jgi:hypothetical protein
MPPSRLRLSDVQFGAFLAYSPRGQTDISRQSRVVCHRIKGDGPGFAPNERMIDYAVRRLREESPEVLREILSPDAVLVPMPRSSPLKDKNALWPSRRIAETLVANGFGSRILVAIERATGVAKSAFAARGERPSLLEHLYSLRAVPALERPSRLVLVDDVVTKGATFLAAAAHVEDAFRGVPLRCFALVRTMGLVPEVERIDDPVVGWIRFRNDDADRKP